MGFGVRLGVGFTFGLGELRGVTVTTGRSGVGGSGAIDIGGGAGGDAMAGESKRAPAPSSSVAPNASSGVTLTGAGVGGSGRFTHQ